MNTLKLDLENCYGIKKLEHNFLFSLRHIQLIYAPNGTMKSSLALALKGISGQVKEQAKDRLHPDLESKCDVKIDGTQITKEQLFVVDPDDSNFDPSGVFTNFLADSTLKSKYDKIYTQLRDCVSQIITPLREVSQSSDCENELIKAFKNSPSDNIFSIFERLASDIRTKSYHNFGFRYNFVFDNAGKIQKFLEKNAAALNDYIAQYNNLLNSSNVFRTVNGKTFGTHQASELSKSVESGEFFSVNHYITLQNGTIVKSFEQLNSIFDEEKNKILNNESLKQTFDKITKAIDGNTEVRLFKGVLMTHPEILIELNDYDEFRKKTWKGYLCDDKVKQRLLDFGHNYQSNKTALKAILDKAREQMPLWKKIIQLYGDRFHVPFKIEIENQEDIILKQDAAKLRFKYVDDQKEEIERTKQEIVNILSRGEQRAFYILQLLFELESRKQSGKDTLLVFDDIADSFDYQNKYAIIEYIHDLDSTTSNMYMLVLTHNFDFYRTLASRLELRNCSWMAVKQSDRTISLKPGQYQKDLFSYFLSKPDDSKLFISMIPFVRNLVEYTEGDSSSDYLTLTSCLHLKTDTNTITDIDVIKIVKGFVKGKSYSRKGNSTPIYDSIMTTADAIITEKDIDEVLIENKIVLSIACRLKAEQYLKQQLLAVGLPEKDLAVNYNQTTKWTELFKKHCPNDSQMSVIERVNMMTPEFIHINSFMYEPLIDLSIHHLVDLYSDVKSVSKS